MTGFMRFCSIFVLAYVAAAATGPITVQKGPVHLRSGSVREWSSFPEAAPHGAEFSVKFASTASNEQEYSLRIRQRDAKDTAWVVSFNGTRLGTLIADERDMVQLLPIPAGLLRTGDNDVTVSGKTARISDDIEIRDIRVDPLPVRELLRQATVDVNVTSAGVPLPVRVTVTDGNGSLVPLASLRTDAREAVRTGVVYAADGAARIGLPAGEYRIYASRGFEYSAPSRRLRVSAGARVPVSFQIVREATVPGMISCDTHVHTLELSGHGDASVEERVLTAAGEGLDAIVVTEHNRFADYVEALRRQRLDKVLIALPGSEVTTTQGHFNIFPVRADESHPDHRERDWLKLMSTLTFPGGVRIVIQNHPRDVHSQYRPFDPAHHISSTGENRNGRPFGANAMEVVNSGAMSSDPLQLVRDWLGLLTRGLQVAAIGASDTHTVDFVPIGQARTYIEDRGGLVQNLAEGRNLVSYGLVAEIRQTGSPTGGTVPVEITVRGPSWSAATAVALYSNGVPVWNRRLDGSKQPGVKYSQTVRVPIPPNDTALVAVATGPGVLEPFWEVRKPYQPTSPDWKPVVIGVSRAIWVDSDGNGKREVPLHIANRLVSTMTLQETVARLEDYDASVTKHVASVLGPDRPEVQAAFARGPAAVRASWLAFLDEYRRLRQESPVRP
jgi:hypothetical protein